MKVCGGAGIHSSNCLRRRPPQAAPVLGLRAAADSSMMDAPVYTPALPALGAQWSTTAGRSSIAQPDHDGSEDSAVVFVDAGAARYQEKKLPNARKIQSIELTNNFAEVRDCRVQNLGGIRNLIAFDALPARPSNRIEV